MLFIDWSAPRQAGGSLGFLLGGILAEDRGPAGGDAFIMFIIIIMSSSIIIRIDLVHKSMFGE